MNESRVFSFSVRKRNTEDTTMMQKLQVYSIRSGIKLSFMILEGLKLYIAKEEEADGKNIL